MEKVVKDVRPSKCQKDV